MYFVESKLFLSLSDNNLNSSTKVSSFPVCFLAFSVIELSGEKFGVLRCWAIGHTLSIVVLESLIWLSAQSIEVGTPDKHMVSDKCDRVGTKMVANGFNFFAVGTKIDANGFNFILHGLNILCTGKLHEFDMKPKEKDFPCSSRRLFLEGTHDTLAFLRLLTTACKGGQNWS